MRWEIKSVFLTALVYFAALRLKGTPLPAFRKRDMYLLRSYTEQVTAGKVTHYQSPP